AGRDFSDSDDASAPNVIVVNESLARKYWGSAERAAGARVRLWGRERTIAGVIGDVRDQPWHLAAVPALYMPQPQQWQPQRMFLRVRTDRDPAPPLDSIRRAL